MDKNSKPWYKSKTIQIAVVQAVGGALVIFLSELDLVGYVALVKSAADVALRVVTDKPVDFKSPR